jgi:hypothetical protein
MLTAVVFQGAQGLGKTILGNVFARLIGEENTASISQADLDGNFNGHFVERLLVIADEVVNQENLKDTASILKKYITDARIMANVKNVPQVEVRNRMAWWFTSNAITPVRVEGPHDRRYTVFSALMPPTPEHKAMMEGIHRADGGFTPEFEDEMAAFADHLATRTVDRTMTTRPFLNTAREALVAASRNSAEAFLAAVKEEGIFNLLADLSDVDQNKVSALLVWRAAGEGGITIDELYDAYKRFCERDGMKPVRKELLGQHVRLAFPWVTRVRVSHRGKRPWAYLGLPVETAPGAKGIEPEPDPELEGRGWTEEERERTTQEATAIDPRMDPEIEADRATEDEIRRLKGRISLNEEAAIKRAEGLAREHEDRRWRRIERKAADEARKAVREERQALKASRTPDDPGTSGPSGVS